MAKAKTSKITTRATAPGKPDRLAGEPFTLRLHPELLRQMDALIPAIGNDPELATLLGGVSRSSVIRAVMVEGLRVLAERYGVKS